MMNLLIDVLPYTVMVGGTEYPINTDFRASVLFELLVQDVDVPEYDRIMAAIDLYFMGNTPEEDLVDIMNAILWFYRCGKDKKKSGNEEEDPQEEQAEPIAYSFEYDADYIYAAFRQQYGINLNTVDHLHWWEFRAMFTGLTQDCEFVKIMGYRVTKITKDMSKTEKAFLRKMKSVHALPVSKKEQEEHDALVDALMNGGDLTGLIDHGGSDARKEDAG